jgi:membrane-bound lytic murein transglycosylase A
MTASGASGETAYSILNFSQLDGWDRDNHAEALEVFLGTCPDLDDPDWQSLCALAQSQTPAGAKQFFELFFRPVLIEDGADPLFTGYFEPELQGSRYRTDRFRYPVYKMPNEARQTNLWLPRRDILTSGVMDGRGLEIAWVDDPVELFFLQIQGCPMVPRFASVMGGPMGTHINRLALKWSGAASTRRIRSAPR